MYLKAMLLIAAVAVLTAGCGRTPTSMKVNPENVLSKTMGETIILTAEVRDEKGEVMPDQPVAWSSSDDKTVAVVDGKATVLASGETRITASSGALKAEAYLVTSIPAKLKPPAEEVTLKVEETVSIKPDIIDDKGKVLASYPMLYYSHNVKVALVDERGVVTGKAPGECVVQAIYGNLTTEVKVTVVK